jgi:hypothetical protein
MGCPQGVRWCLFLGMCKLVAQFYSLMVEDLVVAIKRRNLVFFFQKVFSEKRQISLICNLYGFGIKNLAN